MVDLSVFICPVRDCRLPLTYGEKTILCAKGHSFDISRSGYINLLQPQDRRSRQPGDTAEAIQGRRQLHESGQTQIFLQEISQIGSFTSTDTVLDIGCGEGFYLGNMTQNAGCSGYGIDISTASIDLAAKRYPHCRWIVANADRLIPLSEQSCSVITSITARMNPEEFHRVIRPDGRLLIAIPSPEDLIELRGTGRDRTERTINSFQHLFEPIQQKRITTRAFLSPEMVQGLAASIYRPQSTSRTEPTQVTFGLDLLLFHPRKR